MFRKARRVHMVGIGGSGMSGIAEVLVNLGYPVSGSDVDSNAATQHLQELGAAIQRGHGPEMVRDADVVVISSAIREDNPEVREARQLGIPVIPRAEMLAELMRLKTGVAVAGSHGKTSTTGMIAEVLDHGGLDPTVVIGGRVGKLRSGAKLGQGDLMVAEADESDGSFLKMKPTLAVVTNIDREHLDHYGDLGAICDAFEQFLGRVPFYGAAAVCLDDENVRAILPRVDRRVITYGAAEDAEVRAGEIELSGFTARYVAHARGETLGRISLNVPGHHSVFNSLAAVAVGLELDLSFRTIVEALAEFRGVDRRLQLRGEVGGAKVLDDYGHHPTEIRSTLRAIHDGFGCRTLVVFQPHRYTRTQALLEEFGDCFAQAARVIVTDIYAASEPPIPGVDGARVANALVRHGHPAASYEPDFDRIAELLLAELRPGDVVLTLGAGDVWKVGETLVRAERGDDDGRRKVAR
jgi:UDP-N-acetylmuramate--alanine ligase